MRRREQRLVARIFDSLFNERSLQSRERINRAVYQNTARDWYPAMSRSALACSPSATTSRQAWPPDWAQSHPIVRQRRFLQFAVGSSSQILYAGLPIVLVKTKMLAEQLIRIGIIRIILERIAGGRQCGLVLFGLPPRSVYLAAPGCDFFPQICIANSGGRCSRRLEYALGNIEAIGLCGFVGKLQTAVADGDSCVGRPCALAS